MSRGRTVPYLSLDEDLLITAYHGFPFPSDGNLENPEQEFWRSKWIQAIKFTFQRLEPEDGQEHDIDRTPSQWEYFLSQNSARLLASIEISYSREIWEPIISLGNTATTWCEWFLREWGLIVLSEPNKNENLEKWKQIIEFVFDHERWVTSRSGSLFDREKLWRYLFAFNHLKYDELWKKEKEPLIKEIKPFILKWSEQHLANKYNVESFSYLIQKPASEPLLLPGLKKLSDTSEKADDRFWEQKVTNSIASLLVYAWENKENKIRSDKDAMNAFRNLLSELIRLQVPVAQELSNRIV